MASTRAVLQVFEKYQKDRVAFVQTVAELATRPQNIEPMPVSYTHLTLPTIYSV